MNEPFIPATGFAGPCKGYCFKMGSLGLGYYSGEERVATAPSEAPQPPAMMPEPSRKLEPSRKRVISLPEVRSPEHTQHSKQSRSESPPRQFTLLRNPGAYHTPYTPLHQTAEDCDAEFKYAVRTSQRGYALGYGTGVISLIGMSAADVKKLQF